MTKFMSSDINKNEISTHFLLQENYESTVSFERIKLMKLMNKLIKLTTKLYYKFPISISELEK